MTTIGSSILYVTWYHCWHSLTLLNHPIVCMTDLTWKLFHWKYFRIILWIFPWDWWDQMWKLVVWRRTSSVRSCSFSVWIKLQLQLQTNKETTEGEALPLGLSLSEWDGQCWEGSQYFRWGLPWHPRRWQVSLGERGDSHIMSANLRVCSPTLPKHSQTHAQIRHLAYPLPYSPPCTYPHPSTLGCWHDKRSVPHNQTKKENLWILVGNA